jgi:uncharacterized membrane protein YgdD (TMEM256/DUF423 family)
MSNKKMLLLGGSSLFLAVLLGAFGAHGLKNILDGAAMGTFKTGITYQFYHGIGLVILALVSKTFNIELKRSAFLFVLGTVLFSFNCYLYAITQVKIIALIIPLGGVSFITGWLLFIISISKKEKF